MTGTTTRSGRGTRAAETAARKRRLLDAATELAAEGGYDAVQMRDVAARAEVALGTLYRHYTSKDQLLLAALAQQAATLRERLDQRPPRGATRGRARRGRAAARVARARTPAACHPGDAHRDVVARRHRRAGEARDQRDAARDHRRRRRRRAAIDDLDDIMQVLGAVWFAELTFWSVGIRARHARWATTSRAPLSLLLDGRR